VKLLSNPFYLFQLPSASLGKARNVAVESKLRHREFDDVLQHREITPGLIRYCK